MPILKRRNKRDRGYSIEDGSFKIQDKARQAFNNASVEAQKNLDSLDKTGLIPKQTEDKAQKGWQEIQKNIMDSEGNIKMGQQQRTQGFTPTQDGGVDFSQPIDPSKMSKDQIKALQQQIGAKPDGAWGPGSQRALNKHYAFQGIEPPNASRLNSIFKDAGVVVKKKPDNYYDIEGKRPAHKTDELSSGGDVSDRLISSVENSMLGLEIPGLRITAGNDAYHQSDSYRGKRGRRSAHQRGDALDFTTSDVEGTRKRFLDAGYTFEKQRKPSGKGYYYIYRSPKGVKPKHRILDEYAGKTAKTTGGHFDWKVG